MAIDLKTDPKYGYYPWWPENGDDWVHPEDVALARQWIPSPRVWRRDGTAGELLVLTYGQQTLRVRRSLWRELAWEGFDVGDMVEVRTRGMHNEHRTGTICEMLWDEHQGRMVYELHSPDEEILNAEKYVADDLKHVEETDARIEVRFEPPDDDGEDYEVSTES